MKFLIVVLLTGCAGQVTHELTRSRDRFLRAVDGLTPEQAQWRPAPDKWSIAEVAEHVAVAEESLYNRVTGIVMTSVTPKEHLAQVIKDDARITRGMTDRSNKRQAPEAIKPTGRFKTLQASEEAFKEQRQKTLDYVQTSDDDFRSHAASHPAFGTIDGHQWLLLIAGHTDRHAAQIEEVKASKNFPK